MLFEMNCPINYFSHWSQNTKSYILSEIRFNIQPNIWSDIQSTIQSNNLSTKAFQTCYCGIFSFGIFVFLHCGGLACISTSQTAVDLWLIEWRL